MLRMLKFSLFGFLVGASAAAAAQVPPPQIAYGTLRQAPDGTSGLELNAGSYHLSQQQSLCWVAENIPAAPQQQIVMESFHTPVGVRFSQSSVWVVSNNDNSHHVITSPKTPNANRQYHTCWRFDQSDPFGDYRLQVRIGDVEFPPYSFRWQP